MSSRSQKIQDHIVTTIKAINGGATYQNTISKPSRQVDSSDHSISDLPEDGFPHFSVVLQSESRTKEPGHLYATILFQVICTFKSPQTTQTVISSWLSDVEKALAQDITRGREAIETWVPQIDRDNAAFDPFRVYYMTVEVHTIFNYDDPS